MISTRRLHSVFLVVSTIILLAAVSISAQSQQVPQVSQRGTITQRIGLSDVSLIYSRPAARGRRVFGDWPTEVKGEATLDNQFARPKNAPLVPWGHVWRAGANEATVFAVNDDVMVNGQPLPAGSYSLHMIPIKNGEWTLIFNKEDGQWGSFGYDAAKDALRVKTLPKWGSEHQEMLTYSVDMVNEDSATLNMRWEMVAVPFTVQIKDLAAKVMVRLRSAVAAAKSDDYNLPASAAGYAKSIKAMDDANKFYDQAVSALDLRLKTQENYTNLALKASLLFNAGRLQAFIPVAEKAIAAGKAAKADVTSLEKRLADAKAAK